MVCTNSGSYGLDIDSVMAHKCSPSVTAGCQAPAFSASPPRGRRLCDLSAFKMICPPLITPLPTSDSLDYDLKYTYTHKVRATYCLDPSSTAGSTNQTAVKGKVGGFFSPEEICIVIKFSLKACCVRFGGTCWQDMEWNLSVFFPWDHNYSNYLKISTFI